MHLVDHSQSTVPEVIQGLLGRLSEGLVIAISGEEIEIAHKFSDRGLLNAFLVALLEELISRTCPVDGL
jgi:hypothetical protein